MINNKQDSRPIIVSVAALGTAAILLFAVMPLIVGGMASRFALTDTQSGLVATAYFVIYALLALTSPTWVRRLNWRHAAFGAYTLLLLGIALAGFSASYEQAIFGMAVAGIGAGVLFPISLTLASDTHNTDRTYALKLTAEQLVPASLLLLIPLLGLGAGLSPILVLAAVTVVVCLLASLAMPASGPRASAAGTAVSGRAVWGYLGLLALAVNFAGFGGLWVFFERIATEQGFTAEFTNLWLAVGLITSGLGPLAAAVLADRFGRVLPIVFGTLLALVSIGVLASGVDQLRYALVLFTLPLAYYFAVSYVMAVIAAADTTGKIAGLMAFSLAVGAASGPALFGMMKDAGGPVLMVMGACILLGGILIVVVANAATEPESQE
jgi:predicted MFS family arabinose efflux permease